MTTILRGKMLNVIDKGATCSRVFTIKNKLTASCWEFEKLEMTEAGILMGNRFKFFSKANIDLNMIGKEEGLDIKAV